MGIVEGKTSTVTTRLELNETLIPILGSALINGEAAGLLITPCQCTILFVSLPDEFGKSVLLHRKDYVFLKYRDHGTTLRDFDPTVFYEALVDFIMICKGTLPDRRVSLIKHKDCEAKVNEVFLQTEQVSADRVVKLVKIFNSTIM